MAIGTNIKLKDHVVAHSPPPRTSTRPPRNPTSAPCPYMTPVAFFGSAKSCRDKGWWRAVVGGLGFFRGGGGDERGERQKKTHTQTPPPQHGTRFMPIVLGEECLSIEGTVVHLAGTLRMFSQTQHVHPSLSGRSSNLSQGAKQPPVSLPTLHRKLV